MIAAEYFYARYVFLQKVLITRETLFGFLFYGICDDIYF